MSHSNSSLNTFADCMAKYQHNYILHSPPCKPPSEHLAFGTMAHEVLYKAGQLRDEKEDGLETEYRTVIPSEVLYLELKERFGISSWNRYFVGVVKQVAKYEKQCIEEFAGYEGYLQIEREKRVQLTVDDLQHLGYYGIKQPIVGIIDLLIIKGDYAYILDYKFSTTRKTQDDFDMNSQLQLYAMFVHYLYDIPLHHIKLGYIDIPKQEFGSPIVLSNGTLSRSKNQNVTQEFYKKAVETLYGNDPYYNCEPGGYYYDCYCNLALNKPAYLSSQWLDIDIYKNVIEDLLNAAKMIDELVECKKPFLKKYDAYTCKSCEFLKACKPWLFVEFGG